ncbi:cell wall metabolism sensor histidine kinase WalK [uncultured Selenomonas sp.]|jgi:signal transduction histidine kinase|uniref:sensor histidine kinase n=1 Tax=uncultured Selenomonas sp. TaxID=159275 RepID=UPI0025DEA912|nr:ATP-binding protein [uncultured Selenomonas sp.]
MAANFTNIFGQGRRRLTLFYSAIMAVFLVLLIFVVHKTMEWSITSEQARELMDTASNVAEGQIYLNHHPDISLDDATYKSTNDRLFFYVFDEDGRLLNFARASFRIEPFILDLVRNWDGQEGEVSVFGRKNDAGQMTTRVMMTAKTIHDADGTLQTIYVGKDVTAMYNGMQKSTYAMGVLGVVALIIATAAGHFLSGRAMVPLKEAYEKQRQFAADASHELRTPLAVVMASADLLGNDPSITSPFLKQVIEDVRDEVKKMTKLVSDLLLVARSDNKALKLKPTKFDAAELLGQTARVMQPLAEKKHITIDTAELEKHEIQADEQKIKQLMLILVDNAVKYTPDGGRVTVGFEKAPQGRVRFYVQDTGIGISEEDQKRIFDRFYRVDKARSREMGGNGLGLSIAQEIVNLHQGTIDVQSAPGEGTRFIVELRVKYKA